MTNIDLAFFDSTVALKLALSLGHFLWQGAIIGLLAFAAGCVARHRSQWQYAVNVAALVLMAACLPMNLLWVEASVEDATASAGGPARESVAPQSGDVNATIAKEEPGEVGLPIEAALTGLPSEKVPLVGSTRPATEAGVAIVSESVGPLTNAPFAAAEDGRAASGIAEPPGGMLGSLTARLAGSAPMLVLAWLSGVTFLFLRLLFATSRGCALRREALPVAETILESSRQLARRLGIRREVFVGCCESIAVPVAVGILRPAILFPSAVLTGLTPDQVELVLLHELSHFRRRDHLIVVLQRLVETLLFFHPAVWIVSRQVSIQREHCCDADVVNSGAGPVDYANCLLRIAEIQSSRKPAHAVTLASDGHRPSQLRSRVSRILGVPDPARGRFTLTGILAVVILLGSCLWSLTPETDIAEAGDNSRDGARDESDPTELPVSIPDVVSLRLTMKDASGKAVAVSTTDLEPASRSYATASSNPVKLQDGAIRLKPGKQLLAFRPDSRGEAMLIDLDVPPRDSSKTVQLRQRSGWVGNDKVQLKLEAQVDEREFGNNISIKFRNTGEDDFTFIRPDIQFVTTRWRIIPTEVIQLDGFALTRARSEYSHSVSWSNAVRRGIWIPRNYEEIIEDLPVPEPGKVYLRLQIGPTLHPNLLKVEDPDVVVARDARYRRDGKVSVELDKPEFVLGENVLLHYSVKNQGEEPLRISVSGDYRGSPRALRFKVHAYDEAGKRLADPHPNPWNMGGRGVNPELKPGEKYWLSIPLTKYVQFEKAGTYRLRVFHDLGWNEWSGIPDTTDNSMPKSETVAPIVETTIKLREPSPNDAQTVLDQVTKPRPETAWGQRSPPHGTWSALRYPVYLPLLRKIAGEHQDALATIAAIHTPAATDALIDLAEEGSSRARQLLPGRLPHPNFKTRANWNEAWTKREREVRQSWRDTNRERVMRIAWALLETDETEPTEERKKEWMLGGSLLSAIGKASDFDRFAAAANPIIESLGTVDSEQRQYPSPLTVSANFVVAGHQLLKAGAKADVTPKTAFESMMFMVAIQTNGEFRPVGWRRMTKRLMRHSMPRVRSTCVTSIPVPIDEEFVEPIIDLFDDNSPLVAATALTAVGAAKDSRFLKALLDVSKQAEDKWVRGAASHAASLCRPAPEPEPPAARSDSANEDVSAKARIDSLKIQVAAKEADLTRARLLFKKGLITRREVQRLEIELNSLIDVQKAEESFRKREKNKELAESATATQKANAEARRAALEAQITAKRAELERAKLLSKRGLITKLEVDKLEFELQTVLQTQKAEESIRKAEQELKAAEVAARKVTLKVKLTGESIAGVPLLFQLDVTNHTKSPFEYWCGGPGLYPNASMFVAEITDSTGKSRKVVLHNGQNFEGSGFNRQVEKEASLPAACAPLSPGKYTVTVSCGPTAVLAGAHFEQWPEMKSEPITIEIRDEPQSIERFDDALRDQSAKSPFAKHVARVYGIAPIVNEWLQQLLDDDPSEAFKIVGYLSRCRRLPKGGDGIVLQAAKKHTTSERPEKNLLRYISMIGRNIGSDTSLEAVITIAMADVDNYARSGAVNDLGELSQPKAEKLLVRLAEDPASPVYWSAIRALAQKKNRLALDVLLETLEAGDEKQRVHIINLLKNFADDQDAQEAVKRALDEAPKGDSQESREKKSDSDADDSAAKVPAPKAEAAETALSMAKWSKVLKGLRIRTAAPQTTYEAGDRLPVLAELQNAGDEPIPFSKLYTVRVRILDKNNKWVGYARAGLDITPWEGRTGNFAPGDSLKWTIWLEQSRFNKSVPAGSMVSVDVSVPTQKLVPGKLPTTEYSEPVRIRFDSIPISTLSASDFGNSWSEKNTIIYREVGGLFAPSRSLQIDGSGLCAAVRPESRNPPENPLLPPGRFTVKLSAERLNRIAALLADTDFQALSKAKRLAYPDEPTVLMSISVDGKNFLGEFPDGVIRKTPAVAALQTEMRSVMAIVKKSEAEKTANFDELTKQRREKLLAEADSFQLHLGYYEDPDKPYFALQLQTRPVEANNFFRRSHQLNRKQIETLIGGLEQGSFLRNGKAGPAPNPTYKEGYILYLWCKGHTQYEVLGFPDNKEMLKRLIGLHSSLEGDVARSMSLLLGRMGVRREELPKTEPIKRGPLPAQVRLRVYQGNPSAGDAVKPVIDHTIETGKPFELQSSGITIAGKLFKAVTGRPRFKATVRYNGGTNEFDAEITLGKPLRTYGGVFSGGILEHFVQLDSVK